VAGTVSAGKFSGDFRLDGGDDGPGFEDWYRREFSRLVSVLVRLGAGPDDAADIAAEAFSRALRRWDRVSQADSPTAWVYRVALNLLRRQARRAGLERRATLKKTASRTDPVTVPVWDAVARLPHRQRSAVVLHYLLDLPYRQVASVMGVKEGTVAATLSAARHALKTALRDPEDEGI
jgi:RNA polymerase sigma-70 factor, ECF subfamily